jgi:hypothetical protein
MCNCAGTGDEYEDAERIVDRSGDIDQRPPEERNTVQTGTAISVVRQLRREPPLPVSRPEARFEPAPLSLAEMAQRLQKDLDKQYARARSQLEAMGQKIEVQAKRCVPPKLDDDLQQIRFQRQKVLIANGPVLAERLREERSRLADLEHFKTENRLKRDAHYPESPVLGLGVLFILVLVEAGINGVLFAGSSDQGLFGGWLEALVLSITNVGVAFLFGRIVFPQTHRRGALLKSGALILCVASLAVILAINLFGAHYRDFKADIALTDQPVQVAAKPETVTVLSGSKSIPPVSPSLKLPNSGAPGTALPPDRAGQAKEHDAIQKIFDAPFAFESFMTFFLFVTGLCGATIAAADGYKFDDPFPGYGRRHRRYAGARAASTEALRRILNQSNTIMTGSFQAIARKLDTFAQEMARLLAQHHAYTSEYNTLKEGLDEAARDAEVQLACHERLTIKVRDPELSGFYSMALKPLPPLGEKQVKFYESQDKKLKALQKSAQKEQSDGLGIFDSASADFQKLLAEASHASLEAALGASPREADGVSQ